MWFIWLSATPDVHAIWHLAYPWPAGGWHVNETMRRADLPQRERQHVTLRWPGYDAVVTTPWDQHDKTVAHASKRAMLSTHPRRNSIHMARVTRPKAIRGFASRRLSNTGAGTSVTAESLANVVSATLSTETAAQITRSVLQQTTR